MELREEFSQFGYQLCGESALAEPTASMGARSVVEELSDRRADIAFIV
jgi:hypothetical protein